MTDFETRKYELAEQVKAIEDTNVVIRELLDAFVAEPESMTPEKLAEFRQLMRTNKEALKVLQQDLARWQYTGR